MTWMNYSVPVDINTPIAERAMSPQGLFEVISQGLAMGEAAQSLFAVPWEELLASDIQEVRDNLGIKPVLSGIRSWASHPAVAKALSQA
jgi:hypothetical protein